MIENLKHTKRRKKTHGMPGTLFYGVWAGMKSRCRNPNLKAYKDYGGRGITVCNDWLDFAKFKTDMYNSYLAHKKAYDSTTIERMDNNGNYCLANCCWITIQEQQKNRRPYNGTTNTIPLNVSIPIKLMLQLKNASQKEQRSMSNLVSWLLQRAMKELAWRIKK